MHMSLQQSNEAHGIAVLVIGTFASVFLAALGAVFWLVGTQKVEWCGRVAAFGFWLMGGSFLAFAIETFLEAYHWGSPAQYKVCDHLISASLPFSLTLVVGGAAIGSLIDGAFANKKP